MNLVIEVKRVEEIQESDLGRPVLLDTPLRVDHLRSVMVSEGEGWRLEFKDTGYFGDPVSGDSEIVLLRMEEEEADD